MILSFSIDTPHPQQDTIYLSLEAINRDGEKESVFQIDDRLLARSAVIYGPNNGGKTHLIRSLQFFLDFVSNQDVVLEDDLWLGQDSIEFGIVFHADGDWFDYSIKMDKTRILLERFAGLIHEDGEAWFCLILQRCDGHPTFHSLSIPCDLKDYTPQPRELLLPMLARQGFGDAVKAFNYLQTHFTIVLDLDNPDYQQQVIESNPYPRELRLLLKAMRIDDGPLAKLSRGTRKTVALAVLAIQAIMEGKALIVDDLDAYLHPLVTEYFVWLFQSDSNNSKNAQLIFTASDTSLMRKSLLSRDQIYAIERGGSGLMSLLSILEFKDIDSKKRWDKEYLDHRLGGTPRFCYFDPMWTID